MKKFSQVEIDTILSEYEATIRQTQFNTNESLYFENVDFSNCNFSNRFLECIVFKNCILDCTNFSLSNLKNSRFIDISAEDAKFIGADFSYSFFDTNTFNEGTDFSYCNFNSTKFITGSRLLLSNFNRSSIHLASEIPTNFIYFSDARNNLCALYADHHYTKVWTDFYNGHLDNFEEAINKKYGTENVSYAERSEIERILNDPDHPSFFEVMSKEYKIEISIHRPFFLKAYNLFLNYKEPIN